MKTGTTYVQQMLGHNRARLAEAGVLYPKPWSGQVEAVRDVLELQGGSHLGSIDGVWKSMVDQIHAWPGREVILSVEFISFADKKQAAAMVADLAPSQVTVVLGLRDVARSLPAQWQTSVRNGSAWTYRQYLEGLTRRRSSDSKTHFWRRQDAGAIARLWADVVGPENVLVVTVPPRGAPAHLLWERMAKALEVDVMPLEQKSASNESLGPTTTELLRRVNERCVATEMDNWVYQHAVNRSLSHDVLPAIAEPHPPLAIPDEFHGWVRDESARIVKEISKAGVTVIGDLTDLEPQLAPGTPFVWPEELTDGELLAAAVEALTGYTNVVGERQKADAERGRAKARRRRQGRAGSGQAADASVEESEA